MKIDKITFEYSVTKTYSVEMSEANGYDMPETAKDLVQTINAIKDCPENCVDENIDHTIDSETKFIDYDVVEG